MPEEILDPELVICDAHHHLWDKGTGYKIPARYLLDELMQDIGAGHRVESTVFVEARSFWSATGPAALQSVNEVQFAAGVAAMTESGLYGPLRACAAIVGHANMELGESVGEVLAALTAASGGRLGSVRHLANWHEHPDLRRPYTNPTANLYVDPQFRAAFAQLSKFGLNYDAYQFHTQLGDLASLARAFPDTKIVVDHIGTPVGMGPYKGQREAVFLEWKRSMLDLADCQNVWVKLGGMATGLLGFDFQERGGGATSEELATAWGPYVQTCIEAFGPGRAMFESNFPVDRSGCSYEAMWNAYKRITADYTRCEKALLFKGTAEQFYGIAA